MMKNEPIIAYNHLQDDQEQLLSQKESGVTANKRWRTVINPFVLVVEIAAIITMLIWLIEGFLP